MKSTIQSTPQTSSPLRARRRVVRPELLAGARWGYLAIICAALLLESEGFAGNPLVTLGTYLHADITNWSGVHIIVSVLELLLVGVAVRWVIVRQTTKNAPRLQMGTLAKPLLVFSGLVAFGVVHGTLQGGNLTVALWEVRGFLMMIAAYLLTGIFLQTTEHLHRLIWAVLIGATGLAIGNMLLWLFVLRTQPLDDLAFDHTDSVVLAFATILCLTLLAFGATRLQRRYALGLVPVLIFTMQVMQRRAAFAILAVALIVLALQLLRLRPAIFWKVGAPLIVILAVYLAIFWQNTSVWGQPARAISSTISPDTRDSASNIYRQIEKFDIVTNIFTSPVLGLGFGEQFIFYAPLPDLSYWPFWHYTPHNAVLWVWMKDGAIGFASFWWLLGSGIVDGGRALAAQSSEEGGVGRGARKPHGRQARRRGSAAQGLRGLATAEPHHGEVVALVAAAVCLIPLQVTFSSVDLGLTSERDLLLFGVMLSVLARASQFLSSAQPGATRDEDASQRTADAGAPPIPPDTVDAESNPKVETPPRRREPVGAASSRAYTQQSVPRSPLDAVPLPPIWTTFTDDVPPESHG